MSKQHNGNNQEGESVSEILAETENMAVWRNQEDIGFIYHLEIGNVSLHLMPEEWEELILLVKDAS